MTTHNRSNIVLVGFMASGKSRIGEMLSKRLGYELLDLDAMIEKAEGQSIRQIFEKEGEWHFRNLESKAIMSLMDRDHAVIVTGGGAPMFFDNARALKKLGHIFYLDASLALILKRLTNNKNRPLAQTSSAQDLKKIEDLYTFRRPIYLGLGHVIDVNHENKAQTCDEIIERFKANNRLLKLPKTLVRSIEDQYHIFHNPHIMENIYDIIISLGLKHHRAVIVTTKKLVTILGSTIELINQKLPHPAAVITFSDGEAHKNFMSVNGIHEAMFGLGLTRQTLVIALGGGNVGDVAGFSASIFLRGVPFIQVPTTLLAMVDASIGGKTGIDVSFGKNLIGAFYNPKAVIIDPELLTTLPKDDFSSGMAEIIKHAIIGDQKLFYILKNGDFSLLEVIERALKVKADIVFCDPRETNIRAHLNLGHTFAHAIEKVSNYQIKHGYAVAIGLIMATKLSKTLGVLQEDFLLDLERLLNKFDLPVNLPTHLKKDDILAAMKYDKKRDNIGLKFILPRKIGEVTVQYVDEQDVLEVL